MATTLGPHPQGRSALIALLRHKTWATLRLLEICRDLPAELLDATTPGTFGSIRETLRHIVNSEAGYMRQLLGGGRTPWSFSEGEPDGPDSMDAMATAIRDGLATWERIADDPATPNSILTSNDGWSFPGWLSLGQAIHHADIHRAHVLTILGSTGRDVPELDLWEYAEDQGMMTAPSETS